MRRRLSFLICLMMTVCIWACGVTPARPSQILAKEPPSLKVWFSQNDSENKVLEQIASRFTSETGIPVEVVPRVNVFNAKNDLVNNAETDARPDIVFMQAPDIGELVVSGYLLPLDIGDETRSRYADAAFEAFRYGGEIYGAGYSIELYGLIYNKNLISEDHLPETWSEFFDRAEQLTLKNADGTIAQYGALLDCKDVWFNYPIIRNFGGYYYGVDRNGGYNPFDIGYNNEGMIQYCEFLKEKMRTGIILRGQNQSQSEISAEFMEGRVAMIIYGLWTASYWQNAGIEYGIVGLPRRDDGTMSKPLATVNGFVINRFTFHREEALRFLAYILRDDHQQMLIEAANHHERKTGLRTPVNLSVINSAYVQSDEILRGISEIGFDCEPFPNIPEGTIWYNYTSPALKSIFFDGVDTKTKLDELSESIRSDVQKMNIVPEPVSLPWYAWLILGATVVTAAWIYILSRRKRRPVLYRLHYHRGETMLAWGLLMPLLILLGMFYLFPILHNIYLSMTDFSGVNLKNYSFVGFYNYQQIFTDGLKGFAALLAWTVLFATLVVTISFIFGTFIAVLLDKIDARLAKIYRIIYILPWVVPSVIILLMWSGMLSDNGSISKLLGIADPLGQPWKARFWTILVMIWFSFPYYMIVAYSFLKAIPKDYYEASSVDGAGPVRQFFSITLPLVFRAVLPTLIMGFIMQFNQFGVYILTGGGPFSGRLGEPGATDLLITHVFNLAFNSKRYALAAAYSVVIFIFVSVFSVAAMRVGKASPDRLG